MEVQAPNHKEKSDWEVPNISEKLLEFISEYEHLAKDHVEKTKDLVIKQKVLVGKHNDRVQKYDELTDVYEDVLKKFKELQFVVQIKHEDTFNKFKDLSDKYDGLSGEYKDLVEKHKDFVEKHGNFVQQLRDKVECPVCLAVPNKTPIPICPNGHVVCTKCVRENCPTCRVRMKQGKSTLAVTVIENLDHQCENEGCQEIIPFGKVASHGKSCDHRMVPCPNPSMGCDEMVSLSSLETHMVSCCLRKGRIEAYKKPRVFNCTYTNDLENFEMIWTMYGIRFDNKIFIVKIARLILNGNGRWFFMVQMLGGAEDSSEYGVNIIVHRSDDGPDGKYSQRYCGDVCPIDVEMMEDAEKMGLCLTLTDWAIDKLRVAEGEKKGRFSVTVNLFRT